MPSTTLPGGLVAEEEDVEDHREADGDGEKLPAPQQAPHLESAEGQEWGQAAAPAVRGVGPVGPRPDAVDPTGSAGRSRGRSLSSRPTVAADGVLAGAARTRGLDGTAAGQGHEGLLQPGPGDLEVAERDAAADQVTDGGVGIQRVDRDAGAADVDLRDAVELGELRHGPAGR